MTKTMAVLAAMILTSPAGAQESAERPPKRRAVRSDVRILIEERPEGNFDHDFYEQLLPVEVRSGSARAQSSVWYRTVCRPQEDDRTPVFLPPPPAPPAVPPVRLSLAAGLPRMSVMAQQSAVTSVPGRPRSDPIITKPALFGGGGSADTVTSSDDPMLYGPDLEVVVMNDLSAWSPTRWMPSGASLHLFARALFGSVEMFETSSSLHLYSVGPRLSVPIAKLGSLEAGVTLSAGPAFLHTGIGDAVGFDGGIGLRVEQFFTPAFSFAASVEANLYFSDNVSAFGPVVQLGFNLSW